MTDEQKWTQRDGILRFGSEEMGVLKTHDAELGELIAEALNALEGYEPANAGAALAGIENPSAVRELVEAARGVMEELFSDAAEYDELGDSDTAGMLSDPAYRLQDALTALNQKESSDE